MSDTGTMKNRPEHFADTPCVVVGRELLNRQFRLVGRYLARAAGRPDEDIEYVHQLRVSARRAEAAARLFGRYFEEKRGRRLRPCLRLIRQSAGDARTADVHLLRLKGDAGGAPAELAPVYENVLEALRKRRQSAQRSIERMFRRYPRALLRLERNDLLESMNCGPRTVRRHADAPRRARVPYNLAGLAREILPARIERLRQAASADLTHLENVHHLRITLKKVRYDLEFLACCLPERLRESVLAAVRQGQDRLGEINDLYEITRWVKSLAREDGQGSRRSKSASRNGSDTASGYASLTDKYGAELGRRHQEFLDWLRVGDVQQVFAELAAFLRGAAESSSSPLRAATDHSLGMASSALADDEQALHRRLAAIDVGTNSIRLVVAEPDPVMRFRVIEDVKETTRLGTGVYSTGQLQPSSMESSVAALVRMKATAESLRAERIRVVATSAVREAENRAEFLQLVRSRTGLDVEVLDEKQEARLAFSSVAASFALDDRRIAVVDVGGGSTEVVLSSGGVIDAVCPLPLGAIRLTELHGATNADAKHCFNDVCDSVDRVLREKLRRIRYEPYMIIGTGGTFTTLARISLLQGNGRGGGGRFPFALRGYELRRGEVAAILDRLRRMTLEERRNLPGLRSARAEIIVGGVCIVDRLMQYFGVERLRVHDGGIRDGLMMEMIDELGMREELPPQREADALASARRFAVRCRYEQAHCERVAELALRIFDQLVDRGTDPGGIWSRSHSRLLLHAAGLLHDIGILIEYRRHHKHSYDMVLHAHLQGFTRREVEIIANLCRYHRRSGPRRRHANLQRLGDDDQRMLGHLAGILRIADGLDRSHTQSVSDVTLRTEAELACFHVSSAAAGGADRSAAKRKADVFEQAFHVNAQIEWSAEADAPAPAVAAG